MTHPLQRTPSVAFFDQLRIAAARSPATSAKSTLNELLRPYFANTSEQEVLDKAQRLFSLACTVSPSAPQPAKPSTALLAQLGIARADATQLRQQVSVTAAIIGAMMPLVLQNSPRARLAQDLHRPNDLAVLTDNTRMAFLENLFPRLPQLEIDQALLQHHLHAGLCASFINEALVLGTAGLLSEKCIGALRALAPENARYLRTLDQQLLPALVNYFDRIALACAHGIAAPELTTLQLDTLAKITRLFSLTHPDLLKFVSERSPMAGSPDPFGAHCRAALVRLWDAAGLTATMDRLLAFFDTAEGKEYLQRKETIDASFDTALYRAHTSYALEASLDDALTRYALRAREAEEIAAMLQANYLHSQREPPNP